MSTTQSGVSEGSTRSPGSASDAARSRFTRFTRFETVDVRFPTSRQLDGSDAMNPDPDYSAAYVVVGSDAGGEDDRGPDTGSGTHEGHAFAFTIGRGNDVQVAAIELLRGRLIGRDVDEVLGDLGAFAHELTNDSQLRWLGPEKGVVHMAIGAVLNALWDLRAKRAGQPLWLHLASLSPEELVTLVDFRYLTDVLTPDDALAMFRAEVPHREERIADLLEHGYPAYTTSPGWLGYDDDKLQRLAREAVSDGFAQIKLKVGGNLEDDVRRLRLAREAVGPGVRIAIDANQRWDVPDAIAWVNALAAFDPYWIEEPTSPDDVVGHAAIRRAVRPVKVATGEHAQNRMIFKQLMQLEAVDVVQLDAARVGGVNENLAILLLAKRFDLPVCPHAGGVGLCELVQHLSMFDYVALTGSTRDRVIEYVDHLHEHFVTPVVLDRGHYRAPTEPGGGGQLLASSVSTYRYPDGAAWR